MIEIKFDSAYQSESTYTCWPHGRFGSKTVHLSLRHDAPEYLRERINGKERYIPEYVQAVGILRSSEWYDNKELKQGEVSPAILSAFNEYIAQRHAQDVKEILRSWKRDRPEATEADVLAKLPPPVPAVAGYWGGPDGWVRYDRN